MKCWAYRICTRHLESKDQPLGGHRYGCQSCARERILREREKERKIEEWIAALRREQRQSKEGKR